MNYEIPERASRLAAEYVLGTLRGPARRRFQRLLLQSPVLRSEVHRWELRLGAWGSAIPAEKPAPASLWTGITAAMTPPKPRRQFNWKSWVNGLAAGLVLMAGINLLWPSHDTTPSVRQLTVLSTVAGEPRWTVAMSGRTLIIQALISAPAWPSEKSTELWTLPRDGSPPHSLGVVSLDDGEVRVLLDASGMRLLQAASALAVSLEPKGGSPTGAPTGPVVMTAPVPQTLKAS